MSKAGTYQGSSAVATVESDSTNLMPGVAWLPDGAMTILEVDQLKRLRRKELSPSTAFNLYPDKCAVSMVASRLLPREDPVFEANQLGTAAHAVLEYLMGLDPSERTRENASKILRRMREDREFADQYLGSDLAPKVYELSDEETEKWFEEVDYRTHGLWEIEDPQKIRVFRTEMAFGSGKEFQAKVGKVDFVGFIDRVDVVLDAETLEVIGYIVVDYKFGKYKEGTKWGDDYADQVRLYFVVVEAAAGIKPESGALLFAKDRKRRDIDTSPAAVAETIERFEAAYDRMHKMADENYYPAKVGPLCGWCPLVNVCPAAIKAGKTDLSNTDKVNGRRVVIEGKPLKAVPAVDLPIPTVQFPAPSDREEANAARADVIVVPEKQPEEIRTSSPVSAHSYRETPTSVPTERTNKMITETAPAEIRIREGVSQQDSTFDQVLNSRSYAAGGVFKLTSLALSQLTKNNRPLSGKTVGALAQTYAEIVQNVEFKLTGEFDWNSATGSRVRSVLVTVVDLFPAPWGEGATDWDTWVERVKKNTFNVAAISIKLFELGTDIGPTPWAALVGLEDAETEDAKAKAQAVSA